RTSPPNSASAADHGASTPRQAGGRPAAAQRLDQVHGGRQSLGLGGERGVAGRQSRRLSDHDGGVVHGTGGVLVACDRLAGDGFFGGGRAKRLLGGQDALSGQGVFDLTKGGQHGLAIV